MFSLLAKLRKSSRSKVFRHRMRDADFETLPRQLSAGDITYYNREQKEKGKALVQMHTDFAPVLQVLFHTALDCFRTPNDGLTIEQLLQECPTVLTRPVHYAVRVLRQAHRPTSS